MRETWLVLEDGRVVDPNDCAPDDGGVLRHKGGVAVAKRGDAYHGRSVDVDVEHAKARDLTAAADREMKPAAGGKGYRTRGARSD